MSAALSQGALLIAPFVEFRIPTIPSNQPPRLAPQSFMQA